jgi:Protein of unknown function (DUF3047)
MWSAALPEGKVFPCPLPWWDKRETHQVVRSDLAKLGVWLEEKQPVLDDYERAIGGEPPTRIVAVWLIAVSIFQKRKGICSFTRIKLKSEGLHLATLRWVGSRGKIVFWEGGRAASACERLQTQRNRPHPIPHMCTRCDV